jgi:selenoprotein W-related protein
MIWCRKKDGGFPDIKVLKQKIRDVVNPKKDLGHTDRDKKS